MAKENRIMEMFNAWIEVKHPRAGAKLRDMLFDAYLYGIGASDSLNEKK